MPSPDAAAWAAWTSAWRRACSSVTRSDKSARQRRQVTSSAFSARQTGQRIGFSSPTTHHSRIFEIEQDIAQLVARLGHFFPLAIGDRIAHRAEHALELDLVLRGDLFEQPFGLLQEGAGLHGLALAFARAGHQLRHAGEVVLE